MKKIISLSVLISFSLLVGCSELDMGYLVSGGAGGTTGAGIGYAVDKNNHARGALIGFVAGTLTGMALYKLAKQAREKAAATGATEKKPIILRDKDGSSVISYVVDTNSQGCKQVRSITVDKDGNILGDKVDSVCGKA
jgi:hypothetical protein